MRGGLSVAAMKPKPEDRIFAVLKRFVRQWDIPSVHHFKGDPFRVLISCLLSQRTLEHVTLAASRRLFARADTPRALRRLSVGEIAVLIATARYARTKAQWIHAIALGLEQRSDRVPDTLDGRFDMIAALVALVLLRLETEGEAGRRPNVLLTEIFVDDMDSSLREIGIGDYVVGKHVGRMMGALGGRLSAFREAGGDFATVVRRNVFHESPPSEHAVRAVAERLERIAGELRQLSLADILAGRMRA